MKTGLAPSLTALLLATAALLVIVGCPKPLAEGPVELTITSLRIAGTRVTRLGTPAETPSAVNAGSVTLPVPSGGELVVTNPTITIAVSKGTAEFAVGTSSAPGNFSANKPAQISNDDYLWIKVTKGSTVMYWKIWVTVSAGGGDSNKGGLPSIPSFNINDLPAPAAWTAAGDMYEYPNLFIKANGQSITNPLEWEEYVDASGASMGRRPLNNKIPDGWTLKPGGRRAEVKQLVEYYHQGKMPPPPDTIVLTTDPGKAGGSTKLTLTYQGRSVTMTASITMPTNAPNGKPIAADNKCPLFFSVGSSTTGLTANGWAIINVYPTEGGGSDDPTGPVQSLFQFATDDPDRPSAPLRGAWYASRWMDAAEMGAWGDCVDATKTAVSGVSRYGKAAMITGAFAESKKGTRLTVSIPASSGAGGANVERWTYQKHGLGRDTQGYNEFSLMYLTTQGIGTGTPGTTSGHFGVKIPPKEWSTSRDSLHFRRTQLQNLGHARGEQANWFGPRLLEFEEQHTEFKIQQASNDRGLLSTMPLDTHFLASLSAPNIWIGPDGWAANSLTGTGDSGWVSQEPLYMTYLATKELYDFLECEDNIAVMITMTGHAWPNQQIYMFIDYSNWLFNTYHHPDAPEDFKYKRQSGTQVDTDFDWIHDKLMDNDGNYVPVATWYNPMAREDYLRLTWKNPNRTKQWVHEYTGDGVTTGRTLAENVRAYFKDHPEELIDKLGNPVVIDYPKSVVPEGKD